MVLRKFSPEKMTRIGVFDSNAASSYKIKKNANFAGNHQK
jgi:hypothetical protein